MEIQSMSLKTGSRPTMDLKGGDTIQLSLIILQTKYQINLTLTSQKIFDEQTIVKLNVPVT